MYEELIHQFKSSRKGNESSTGDTSQPQSWCKAAWSETNYENPLYLFKNKKECNKSLEAILLYKLPILLGIVYKNHLKTIINSSLAVLKGKIKYSTLYNELISNAKGYSIRIMKETATLGSINNLDILHTLKRKIIRTTISNSRYVELIIPDYSIIIEIINYISAGLIIESIHYLEDTVHKDNTNQEHFEFSIAYNLLQKSGRMKREVSIPINDQLRKTFSVRRYKDGFQSPNIISWELKDCVEIVEEYDPKRFGLLDCDIITELLQRAYLKYDLGKLLMNPSSISSSYESSSENEERGTDVTDENSLRHNIKVFENNKGDWTSTTITTTIESNMVSSSKVSYDIKENSTNMNTVRMITTQFSDNKGDNTNGNNEYDSNNFSKNISNTVKQDQEHHIKTDHHEDYRNNFAYYNNQENNKTDNENRFEYDTYKYSVHEEHISQSDELDHKIKEDDDNDDDNEDDNDYEEAYTSDNLNSYWTNKDRDTNDSHYNDNETDGNFKSEDEENNKYEVEDEVDDVDININSNSTCNELQEPNHPEWYEIITDNLEYDENNHNYSAYDENNNVNSEYEENENNDLEYDENNNDISEYDENENIESEYDDQNEYDEYDHEDEVQESDDNY